jgi:RNA polymerase sigma-70 factor (ECF subfamily)
MDAATATFHDLRPKLQRIACRMLGSESESEDIVQDVWLRWHEADEENVNNAEAWLVTTTTRISIDRLRSAKARREQYVGIWPPEPLFAEWPATPEDIEELSSEVTMAFLTVLERLTPEARATFLLREVFDVDYGEVAEVIGKSKAACRQIVHRAKAELRQRQPLPEVPSHTHQTLMRRFAEALQQGDCAGMESMLADTAVLMGDDGGLVSRFPKPMVGGRRIARFLVAANRRCKDALHIELATINGQYAVLRYINGELESAQSCASDGERITRIHLQRNPEKLARLLAAIAQHQVRPTT